MRQRINRACVASSSNYAQSKKVHRAYLKEQHEKNNIILMTIKTRPVRQKEELELFEEGLKRQIDLFKFRGKEATFIASL